MFSVVFDFTHPRLCKELKGKEDIFFDIGETEAHTLILKNLMNEVLDYKSPENVDLIFEDFCKTRTLSNDNHHFQKIHTIFKEFKKWYTGNKTCVTKMYLVKRSGNKITNIHDRWLLYRETPEVIFKKKKNKNSLYV